MVQETKEIIIYSIWSKLEQKQWVDFSKDFMELDL